VTSLFHPLRNPKPEGEAVSGVNYRDTVIAVARDSVARHGEIPPLRAGKPTVARLQFEMIHEHPYQYTSEDVLFATSAEGRGLDGSLDDGRRLAMRLAFFEKPRACLRASPLAKQFGWGLHFDSHGRVAAYGVESEEYRRLLADPTLRQLEAMRSRRA
jgi:uncharacterized protein DUF6157